MRPGSGLAAGPGIVAPARHPDGRPDVRADPSRSRAVTLRVAVLAGRAEAARLCRSPLVLASVLIAAVLIWWNSRTVVPQWWVWDLQIDSTLLAVAGAVLVTTQLAAARVRRDGAEQLYDSYPTGSAARTGAHLLSLGGPLLLTAALAGAAVIWLDVLGPVGTPRLAVLAQGLLLVALAGAIGIALGSWLPSPMAAILSVIVLGTAEADMLWPFGGPLQLSAAATWLFPWTQPVVAGWLPGPTSAIPPPGHLAWLAALTGLAAVAALWRVVPRRRLTRLTPLIALATAVCLAVAGWSGWAQTRPVPLSVLTGLLYQATHPGQAERCASQQRVRYCAYPGFQPDVARWATVVNGVLGRLPRRPATALVVRQVVDTDIFDTAPGYVGYQPAAIPQSGGIVRLDNQLARFLNAQGSDLHLIPGSSVPPVYVDVGWGRGVALGSYQLGVALQVASWVAGLPTTWQRNVLYTCGRYCSGLAQIVCLPVDQAREAVALWLAAAATPAARAAFPAGPRDYAGPGGRGQFAPVKVGGRWISSYVPTTSGYTSGPQIYTRRGIALAEAMLRLPEQRVEGVLAARWPGWLNPRATDAQLAAALGVHLPIEGTPGLSTFNRGEPSDPVCR